MAKAETPDMIIAIVGMAAGAFTRLAYVLRGKAHTPSEKSARRTGRTKKERLSVGPRFELDASSPLV